LHLVAPQPGKAQADPHSPRVGILPDGPSRGFPEVIFRGGSLSRTARSSLLIPEVRHAQVFLILVQSVERFLDRCETLAALLACIEASNLVGVFWFDGRRRGLGRFR
jgi:hypothetical protein